MDAFAYLSRQGWRGSGHGLHPGGVKKPLMVSKKSNNYGIGKKKIDAHGDAWWSRVFDAGLKNFDPQSPGPGPSVPSGELSLFKAGGRKWTGLYDGFVKGKEDLAGTMPPTVLDSPEVSRINSSSQQPTAGTERRKSSTPCAHTDHTARRGSHSRDPKTQSKAKNTSVKKKRKRKGDASDRRGDRLNEDIGSKTRGEKNAF